VHNGANASLAHLLSCSLEIADFQTFPESIQLLLLAAVPTLVGVLATNRSLQLLREHSVLLGSKLNTPLDPESARSLQTWLQALGSVLEDTKLSSSIREVALEVLEELWSALPLPIHPIPPEGPIPVPVLYQVESSLVSAWEQVSQCLATLDEGKIDSLLSYTVTDFSERNTKRFLLVTLLVRKGRIPITKLPDQRLYCLRYPDSAFASALLPWLVSALQGSTGKQVVQMQWYRDTLDSLVVLRNPIVVARLLGWLGLCWSNSSLQSLLLCGTCDLSQSSALLYCVEQLIPTVIPLLLSTFAKNAPRSEPFLLPQIDLLSEQHSSLLSPSQGLSLPLAPQIASLLKRTIFLLRQNLKSE
jgi:hypothetical protein